MQLLPLLSIGALILAAVIVFSFALLLRDANERARAAAIERERYRRQLVDGFSPPQPKRDARGRFVKGGQ